MKNACRPNCFLLDNWIVYDYTLTDGHHGSNFLNKNAPLTRMAAPHEYMPQRMAL